MDYDTFVGQVQNRASLPGREDAVRVSRIVLETLSERVDPGAADNLAAQLPDEIGRHLSKVGEVESFEWQAFVDRIVEKGEYDPNDERADAVHHARVVVDVIEEATSEGALEDVRVGLPEEYEDLFVLADQDARPVEEEQQPEQEE